MSKPSWMIWWRSRNLDWTLHKKRSDTLVKTVEKTYWVDFGVRWDMKLWTLLKKLDADNLDDIV